MKANWCKHTLKFKRASGTSRGVLHYKETWLLHLEDHGKKAVGECGMLKGLSIDDRVDYEQKLQSVCERITAGEVLHKNELREFPSIQFGLETAYRDLQTEQAFMLFPSEFTEGEQSIPINGLIWMGTESFMSEQIEEKLKAGFDCIKIKIGALEFNMEYALLKSVRKRFSSKDISLRVDANGAFSSEEALTKLNRLAELDIHSIEQPIKWGQWEMMAKLCEQSPVPIALDEELIGIFGTHKRKKMLQTIKPQYIILKPGLLGGFRSCEQWIALAREQQTDWWVTSALESNIGLNAISQWTYTLGNSLTQGLGTGGLFTNNFDCPLEIDKGQLWYNRAKLWKYNTKGSKVKNR